MGKVLGMGAVSEIGASPRGPDEVRRALMAATERVCSQRPPGSVTVRDIAEAAGVNHGLVHHYFNSKRALLEETLVWIESGLLEAIADFDDPERAVGAFFDELATRSSYPRLLIWMLLEGVDMADRISEFPAIDHLRGLLEDDPRCTNPRLRLHDLLLFLAGLATIDDFAGYAAGVSPSERAAGHQHARSTAIAIALGARDLTSNRTDGRSA
jgi:AcrR family transcriptional regulator